MVSDANAAAASPFEKPKGYQPPERLPVLYDAAAIGQRLAVLAREIKATLGDTFLVVALLRGSFMFVADLLRALHAAGCQPQIDFMTVSSYGSGTRSTGQVTLHHRLRAEVGGKPVLLVDDILESGHSLQYAVSYIMAEWPASLSVCVLLDKPGNRQAKVEAHHVGFTIDDRFVVGYGMDYAGHYRELPHIAVLESGG